MRKCTNNPMYGLKYSHQTCIVRSYSSCIEYFFARDSSNNFNFFFQTYHLYIESSFYFLIAFYLSRYHISFVLQLIYAFRYQCKDAIQIALKSQIHLKFEADQIQRGIFFFCKRKALGSKGRNKDSQSTLTSAKVHSYSARGYFRFRHSFSKTRAS